MFKEVAMGLCTQEWDGPWRGLLSRGVMGLEKIDGGCDALQPPWEVGEAGAKSTKMQLLLRLCCWSQGKALL